MLAAIALAGLQVVTSVGPVITVGQVVAVQPLLEVAGTGVHDAVGVAATFTVLQVVVV